MRANLALGRLHESEELLIELERLAAEHRRWGEHQEILILQALCLMRQSRISEASAVLGRALAAAEGNGSIRPFVDEGKAMIKLLEHRLDAGGEGTGFIRRLLEACRTAEAKLRGEDDAAAGIKSILTARERQVLELMMTGMPNRLIAERLNITHGTLKTHINHIYQKLMVSDRWSAVSRAKELMQRSKFP